MKAKKVMELLTNRIPNSESYLTESYGAFGVDLEADINKVLYCVTPTKGVLTEFREGKYDLLISHHPFIQRGIPQVILHTALDCCKGGLNDMWADALGLKEYKHFDKNLGRVGDLPEPMSLGSLAETVSDFTGGYKLKGQIWSRNNEPIKSVAICTGLGGLVTGLAANSGADCYIVGEMCYAAEKSDFKAVIEVGHTLTEFMGVNLIKETLGTFGVEVYGADLRNDCFANEVYTYR